MRSQQHRCGVRAFREGGAGIPACRLNRQRRLFYLQKRGREPQVRASAEGLVHPEKEATNEGNAPSWARPLASRRLLLAEKYQFSAETLDYD